jgi:hypothetical protein
MTIATTEEALCVLQREIADLKRKLGIARRGLHVLSLRYGTNGLADQYLTAINEPDHSISGESSHD